MTHTHGCDVAACLERVECCGYRVGGEDAHCIREEDGPILCDLHQDWEMCDWCGAWHDRSLGRYCSESCRGDCEGADLADHEAAEADYHNKDDKES